MSQAFPIDRMRGRAVVPLLLLTLIVGVGAALFAYRWKTREAMERAARVAPVAASTSPRPAAQVAEMGHTQLLAAARRALAEHRLLAPAGNNAFAYYLEARKRQPRNTVATSALRELFPFAVESAEQTIDAGRFDEAEREIALLDQADPTNYSLNILRAKLDAQRKLAQTRPAPQPVKRARPQAPRTETANVAPAATPVARKPSAVSLSTPKASTPVVADPQPAPRTADNAAPPAPSPVRRTPPLLLRQVRPAYPAAARRAHRQGWVDVSYTVNREGRVVDARVVAAEPRHVFDIAALNAVRYWEYKPARRDGKAVAEQVQSRILFRL